ncbi:MAPEG family protein [Dongia sp.]|uniref:MAPEG family protein n=1 Tax=Dongia sp. TaxID=1977262 RepID=UPI0035AEE837
MVTPLSTDLMLLVWSVALCVVQMLIAVCANLPQVGLPTLAGNRDNMPAAAGLAGRALRAHYNMLENLGLFAALILVAHVSGRANEMTALGAQLFFWARLAYALVYLIGIPWVRTGTWVVSMAGIVLIFLQLL